MQEKDESSSSATATKNDSKLTAVSTDIITKGLNKDNSFGGHVPFMLLGSDVYSAAKENELSKPYNKTIMGYLFNADFTPKEANAEPVIDKLSNEWIAKHAIQADPKTLTFPDGCALKEIPLEKWDDIFAVFYSVLFFGVFMWLPLAGILNFTLFPLPVAVAILAVFLTACYALPWDFYPACFRTGWAFGMVQRYYSYRMVIESPVESYTSVPSIYCFGPHGVFSISPVIQALLNEFVLGENMHFLAASAALMVPVYNVYLRMMGFRAVDRKPFVDTLTSGRSVGIIPGGIAEMFSTNATNEVMNVKERKGFIAIALETGSQVVPCYCFGNTQTFIIGSNSTLEYLSLKLRTSLVIFWGRYGLPAAFRTPQLTVVGRPILVPKVDKPSKELINEYHEKFLAETRRIYDTYKNTYNWQDRELIFKK